MTTMPYENDLYASVVRDMTLATIDMAKGKKNRQGTYGPIPCPCGFVLNLCNGECRPEHVDYSQYVESVKVELAPEEKHWTVPRSGTPTPLPSFPLDEDEDRKLQATDGCKNHGSQRGRQ